MKNLMSILCFIFLAPLFIFSQTRELKLTNLKTKKTVLVKKGDKVLMAVKTAKYQIDRKPADVYVLSKQELADSAYVTTKARILSINDSTLIIRERNSLFSASKREININKINTLRKLTIPNQLFRTAATTSGSLALAIMLLYSYVATGGGHGFIAGMFEAAGAGFVLTRFGHTKIAKKQINNWKIEVVNAK